MGNLCSSDGAASTTGGAAPRQGGEDRNQGRSQQPDVVPE